MGAFIELTTNDDHKFGAYLARPKGKVRGGIVVAQEIFGVNEHIRDVCDRFAAEGYAALAPALFDRVEPGVELEYNEDGIARGRALMGEVPWEGVTADIAAARAHLSGDGKVGIVGYCWGGTVAWVAATEGGFDAAICYYGGRIVDFVDREPACPTLLHFGDQDGAIPLADVEKIRAAHPGRPIHVYGGAGHGFNCDRRGSHHPPSAALANKRTLAFLAENLG